MQLYADYTLHPWQSIRRTHQCNNNVILTFKNPFGSYLKLIKILQLCVQKIALELGAPSWAMHLDIKYAFKCLPLAPSQWHFTGFCFQGAYFIQTQTIFGAAVSCLHFEKIARLLKWIIQNEVPGALITNYLDDFWLTQKTKTQILQLAEQFIRIVENEIGFPISHNEIKFRGTHS